MRLARWGATWESGWVVGDVVAGRPFEGKHAMGQGRTRVRPLHWFRNLTTARKLLVGFLCVSVLMSGVGVLGLNRLAVA